MKRPMNHGIMAGFDGGYFALQRDYPTAEGFSAAVLEQDGWAATTVEPVWLTHRIDPSEEGARSWWLVSYEHHRTATRGWAAGMDITSSL